MTTEGTTQTAGPHPVVARDLDEVCDRAREPLQRLAGSTVLVAGAAGFLPSYVVDALARANERVLAEPCRIVCLDNLLTGVPERLAHLEERDDVVFLQKDVTQDVAVDGPVDWLVHGASVASPTWYRRYPLETIDVNVTGTRRLLDLVGEKGARSFLYLSSSEIYGDPPPDQVPTTEEFVGLVSCTGPRAPYDESKRLAETLCTTYFRLHETPVKLVRPFNVFGPRLRLDDGRVVPDFVRDALGGGPVRVLSDGRVTRSFCYIADFVAGLLHLLVHGRDGEAYNLGNDEETTILALAELTAGIAGEGVEVEYARSEDPLYLTDNPQRRCPDLTKTKAAVDWRPEITLRDGLSRTLAHYREGGVG